MKSRLVAAASLVVLAAACTSAPPPPPPAPPPSTAVTASIKVPYDMVKANILKSLEQLPEARLSFQATKDVRTFRQLFGHIADSSYFFCSNALGETAPTSAVEKDAKTKADLQKALTDAFAYCDRAFAAVNDQTGAAEVTIAAINNLKTTKLGVLSFHVAHAYEHYGNLVTYLRLNKMVPPSSQSGGM